MNELLKMRQRMAALIALSTAILATADANGVLTADKEDEFANAETEIKSLQIAITRRENLDAIQATVDATSNVTQALTTHTVAAGEGARVTNRADADLKRGFHSYGEFCQKVIQASLNQSHDPRLKFEAAAPGTFGNESSGADGGFLLPPQFSQDIFTYSLEGQSLLPLTDNTIITGNSMVFPKDETTPWGTDGVRAYWQAEATAATATKPKLSTTALRLHKLMALVPLTDELVADAGALSQYLTKKTGDSIRWKTNEAILYGVGNGTPMGALKGNATVTVAKDSGQTANTLTVLNLANMIARLPEGSFGKAVWLVNNDVLPALFTLTLGNYPIYMPINSGVQDNPYGMLLGRPVMVTQHANTFSALGDVQLHDMSFYRTITKAGGVETATSMHLYFDADAMAFRTTFRIDGQPAIVNPINPAKGSKTLSPFLQLQNR